MIKNININEHEMEYAVFGSGKNAFVMLPGLSLKSVLANTRIIEKRYEIFSTDYTVYLPDRIKSPPEDYTIYGMAEDTAAWLKALGIKNACVFGASQGGMIAQVLAIKYPELVGKLALVSTLSKTNKAMEKEILRWSEYAQNGQFPLLAEKMAEKIYAPETYKKMKGFIPSLLGEISEEEKRRFIISAKAIIGFNTANEIKNIRCPVTVIGSEGDRVTGAEGCKEIAEALECEIFMYDESYGHAVYDEAPDCVSRIYDFFKS